MRSRDAAENCGRYVWRGWSARGRRGVNGMRTEPRENQEPITTLVLPSRRVRPIRARPPSSRSSLPRTEGGHEGAGGAPAVGPMGASRGCSPPDRAEGSDGGVAGYRTRPHPRFGIPTIRPAWFPPPKGKAPVRDAGRPPWGGLPGARASGGSVP